MIKRKMCLYVIFTSLFILSSCSNSKDLLSTDDYSIYSNSFDSSCLNINNIEVIEECEYYRVIYSNSMYYYSIFDKDHNIVKSDGPLSDQPHIMMTDKYLVRFTLQTGTGIGTQWGYYYDTQTGNFSQNFQSIYDQSNNKIAYGDVNKVIIRDIFSSSKYFYEISSFKYPLAYVAEPITNVEFVNNGASVEISYLSGINYLEVTEIVDLI